MTALDLVLWLSNEKRLKTLTKHKSVNHLLRASDGVSLLQLSLSYLMVFTDLHDKVAFLQFRMIDMVRTRKFV